MIADVPAAGMLSLKLQAVFARGSSALSATAQLGEENFSRCSAQRQS